MSASSSSSSSSTLTPRVIRPNAGKVIHAFGEEIIIHIGGKDTGGKFTMFTEITPPGGGPPPHYHEHEDEWFYPLEGRVEFFMDDAWSEVPVGSAVYVPVGAVHTFRNVGDTPLKMLIHTTPAGIETFFDRCAEVFAADGEPDMRRILEISAEHGIQFADAE